MVSHLIPILTSACRLGVRGDHNEGEASASERNRPLILDESLRRTDQLDALDDRGLWIVNLRVSKMGGLLRSLALAKELIQRGIGIVVGAQVGETSLLTRAGLTVAHAAMDNLHAMEGAFGTHLLQRDLTTPCLMFGDGGVLNPENYLNAAKPGFGLAVNAGDLNRNQA